MQTEWQARDLTLHVQPPAGAESQASGVSSGSTAADQAPRFLDRCGVTRPVGF